MDNDSVPSQIPLLLIPSALQRLELPPDDAQVLLTGASKVNDGADDDGDKGDYLVQNTADSNSDEYMEGPSTRRRTRTTAKRRVRSSSSSVSSVAPPDSKKRKRLTIQQ
ncbi:hypothetical protein B0H13DRAFT_2366064 [Mycena leptocephala]|nr:hypothetical protein B0H13DRAFT_2366064 [Mycena leptocephala]